MKTLHNFVIKVVLLLIFGHWVAAQDSASVSPTARDSKNIDQTSSVLQGLKVWGSAFLICLTLYVIVRPRFPLAFNFRNTVQKFNTPLASENHGTIGWIWRIFKYSDDEIFENCGMDGIVLIRILRLGMKLSIVGVINAIYLLPIYVFGCPKENNVDYDGVCKIKRDKISNSGLNHLAHESDSLYAVTIAIYVLFGSAMIFLFQEFEWFTKTRHKFLALARTNNYTIYVAHIPEEYRSDIALLEYFQSIFGADAVVDAKIARNIPILDSKVALRETTRTNLESAMNVQNIKGKDPYHVLKTGKIVDSIPHYELQIQELNSEISILFSDIDAIKLKEEKEYVERRDQLSKIVYQDTVPLSPSNENVSSDDPVGSASANEGIMYNFKDLTIDSAKAPLQAVKVPLQAVKGVYDLLKSTEEGSARDAGFVSFSRLCCKAQALQTIHDQTPFTFEVVKAPLPNYIFWKNVGLSHKNQQIGTIITTTLWVALCIFWTVISAALSGLVEIENLEKAWPDLKNASEKLRTFLTNLQPILVVLSTALVPPIMRVILRYEGHISLTALEASLYSKVSWFFIVQVFYMQAISGSVLKKLKDLRDDPAEVLTEDLGRTIPSQVGRFISYVLVKTFSQCIFELTRVGPVLLSLLRKCFGPNLTEKESQRTWMGLSPLTVPTTLDYPRAMSYIMLNFIFLLVFSCIAPIMSFISVVIFLLHALIYRNQLIYTYSHENDSGGQFWESFMKIMIVMMVISEITLIFIVSTRGGIGPAILLLPLLAITFFFSRYLHKEHFRVTEHLPSVLCMKEDLKNRNLDISFLKGKYSQPALVEREISLGGDDSEKGRKSEAHSTQDFEERLIMSTSDNCVHPSEESVSFRGDNAGSNDSVELRESEVSNIYNLEEQACTPEILQKSASTSSPDKVDIAV